MNNKMKGTRQQGSDGRKERQTVKERGQWTAFRLRVPVPQERSTADAVALRDRCLSEETGHRAAGSACTHICTHLYTHSQTGVSAEITKERPFCLLVTSNFTTITSLQQSAGWQTLVKPKAEIDVDNLLQLH